MRWSTMRLSHVAEPGTAVDEMREGDKVGRATVDDIRLVFGTNGFGVVAVTPGDAAVSTKSSGPHRQRFQRWWASHVEGQSVRLLPAVGGVYQAPKTALSNGPAKIERAGARQMDAISDLCPRFSGAINRANAPGP